MNELMNMPKYESYKDSGIEALGNIPTHWNTNRFKNVFKLGKGLTITKENLQDEGIPCVNYGEIHSKYGFEVDPDKNDLKCVSVDYLKSSTSSLLKQGDFVFADTSEDIEGSGNFTYLNSRKDVFAGYHTIIARPKDEMSARFLAYAIDSMSYRNQIRKKVKGVKVYSITQAILKSTNIWLPPEEERIGITKFLDQKTTKINQVIAIKQKQIELLKERKQVMSQQAVTRGLNPNGLMKDSGVDWIGEIPEKWRVESFKNVLVERNKKNDPIESRERLSLSIDKGITLYSEKTTNLDRFKDDFSQYKLTHRGDLVFNSMNMIVGAVGVSNYFGCVSPVYYTFYTQLENPKITKYYEYFFKNKIVQSQLYCLGKGIMAIDRGDGKFNTVRLKVSRDDLRSMKVPYPTVSEITEIVDFIELESSKISKAIRLQEQQIEKIKEYKATLINSAVTGKIKVPEVI
jgi:type I restriction enzyme S subunit